MSFASTAALIVVSFVFIWQALRRLLRLRNAVNKLPGIPTLPLLGNVHQLYAKSEDVLEQIHGLSRLYNYSTHPRVIRAWLGPAHPYIVVFGAAEIEAVLTSSNSTKSRDYQVLLPWLGRGLLTNEQPFWKPRRKLLTPTFHYDILKDFVPIFDKHAITLCSNLLNLSTHATNTPIEVYSHITLMALDIISETAMGKAVGAQNNPRMPYVNAVYMLNDMIFERQTRPWLWPDVMNMTIGKGRQMKECITILHDLTKQVIKERRAERTAATLKSVNRRAFLDLLLDAEEDGAIDSQSLLDEVTTFMFEGHDTTTASINWTLFLLGNHLDWQRRVQAELDLLFADDIYGKTTFEHLTQMPVLDMCIKESLRMYPSVPLMGRQLASDVQITLGQTIPKGATVLVNIYTLHRDEREWPDADLFNPSRFSADQVNNRHPYAYIPFSAAARNCIGQRFAMMEIRTVVSRILRKFDIRAKHRVDQVRPTSELILRPKNGIHLYLSERTRNE